MVSSAAAKLRQATEGPCKSYVEIYGQDEDGVQHVVRVTADGELVVPS